MKMLLVNFDISFRFSLQINISNTSKKKKKKEDKRNIFDNLKIYF